MKSSIVSIVIAYIIGIIIGLYNITCIVLFLFTLICFFIYVVPEFKKIKKRIKFKKEYLRRTEEKKKNKKDRNTKN